MKSIILFFLFLGVISIIMGIKRGDCPPPTIQYQYIPRDFNDEQMNQVPLMSLYGDLFMKNDIWSEQNYPGIFYDKKEKF